MRSVLLPRRLAALTVGVLAIVAFAAAHAETTPKVWTNEDLERMFGPSESSAAPLARPEAGEAQWQAVESFLERQYRRIEEEKQRELQREEIRAAYPPPEPRYVLGLAPGFGSGWWWPGDGWRPWPAPYRESRRDSGRILAPRSVPGSTGTSRKAAAVNPVGRPVSSSARSVNPASER